MSIQQLRSSQLITTFGTGAMVDLPDAAVIISGPDHWTYREDQIADHLIREPRLSKRVAEYLNQAFNYTLSDVELRRPPRMRESFQYSGAIPLVTGWKFPEWYVVQKIEDRNGAKGRRLVGKHLLETNGQYRDQQGKSHKVVPIRFVRACESGHVDDIDWLAFVHHKTSRNCPKAMQGLYLVERGNSGALSDIVISCECGESRTLAAAQKDQHSLGSCTGRRPWLGPLSREKCGRASRLLVRSASNSYFPQLYSVISIPERSSALATVLRKFEADLQIVTSVEILAMARQMNGALNASLGGRSNQEVFDALQSLRTGVSQQDVSAKTLEFGAITGPVQPMESDQHDGDFLIRHLPPELWRDDPLLADCLQQVVLVDRLREVVAQVGFTRFESAGKRLDGELDMDLNITPAPLAKDKINIIPAFENRGEGFFLHFSPERINAWMARKTVQDRAEVLRAGYAIHAESKGRDPNLFHGVAYYFLHTFSHLLLQRISLDCGYPASSIKERIYCNAATGHYGILLYTGTSDAEGTLGGLVEAAKSIRGLFHSTLESAAICSADPVCSNAKPQQSNPNHLLLGSACHCCTHLPETCCEQMNQYLDRALVIPTLEGLGCEFFPVQAS